MGRINLYIIHKDKNYVKSLSDYIMFCHSRLFQVYSSTEESRITEIISREMRQEDVCLISPEIYRSLPWEEKEGLFILLTDGNNDILPGNLREISRYQLGDVIVGSILRIYSEQNHQHMVLPTGSKRTKVIAVYSPAGGTGKTSVAVGASIQCAWEGKCIFYLNLEDIASTSLYFNGGSEGGLSQALFYIQERGKNAAIKIEGLKCIEPRYKVHYFSPHDCALDITEERGNHLANLIGEIKNTLQYDRIFIDMSSGMNRNNFTILNTCDRILLLTVQDPIVQTKVKLFYKELAFLWGTREEDIMDRIEIVVNKFEEASLGEPELKDKEGKESFSIIPRVAGLAIPQGERIRLDLNSPFGTAIHKLVTKL